MTVLRYDDQEDRYVGKRLAVDRDAFDDAVEELIAGGLPEQEAILRLMDESEWSPDIEGVELLLDPELAVSEAERIVRRRR